MEENKDIILISMTSQMSKGVFLLRVKLVQHLECNAFTALTVFFSMCITRGHEHVFQNVK